MEIKKFFRTFRFEWYKDNSWLCGCQQLQKLFRWPCLLFSIDQYNIWTKNGVCDMNNFQNLKKRYESSVEHIASMVSCLNFGKHVEFLLFSNFREMFEFAGFLNVILESSVSFLK